MLRIVALALFVAALTALCCNRARAVAPVADFGLRVISSRPDMVSGGDVLVELRAPARHNWTTRLNHTDVTASFHTKTDSDVLFALLSGLHVGENSLEIRSGNRAIAQLMIGNHPSTGPILSGPHQQPFKCQTQTNGLGPALDSDCTIKTRVEYYYKSTQFLTREAMGAALGSELPGRLAPGFKLYDPSGGVPSDVAQTTTSEGRTVNYIVRRETGTINRAIYDIQFLHEPGQRLPSPWTRPTAGWNGRLVYVFGGGCGAGYRQGTLGVVGRTQEPLLAHGYAVATSTLNSFATSCNPIISAETMSMVKEHFIKAYGVPVHTIGWGTSGGAMQEYLIAQQYPGLLDGIIPVISFPDMTSTIPSISDCALLEHAFKLSKKSWTEAQKAAVSGFATFQTCASWGAFGDNRWPLLDVTRFCAPEIPREAIYDRVSNPKGVRCDVYESEVNVLGLDPRSGFTRRPLDNVGVQYGLAAFNSGKIDAEQFLELNELVGGYDEDGNIVAERTLADEGALRLAYRRGLVLTGGGGLQSIPILDWRPYSDDGADQHDEFRTFVTRARLIAANGNADNQIIFVDSRYELPLLYLNDNWNDPDARFVGPERELVALMDRWLDNIAADDFSGPLSERVVRNKPKNLIEGCRATDGERIVEPEGHNPSGKCSQLYPPHGDPRLIAGAPSADDILKCALRPIDVHDYVHAMTPDQLRLLDAIFSQGVCDFSRPGVGQEIARAAWH